jgi:hypothetical protein
MTMRWQSSNPSTYGVAECPDRLTCEASRSAKVEGIELD